ncbi:putative Ig domain-containing protein, partial [Larkinella ripae]
EGVVSENSRVPRVEFIRIFPADLAPEFRQSIAANYLISGPNVAYTQTLEQNLNSVGAKSYKLPNVIGNDPFIDVPWDDLQYPKVVLQGANGGNKYVKEIEIWGSFLPNPPPIQVGPFNSVTVTEGDSVSVSVASTVSDPGDTLTYSAILNGNVAVPSWMSIDPVSGVLSWKDVPFESTVPGETQTYYPLNIIVVDSAGSQIVVPMTGGFFVKRKNAVPAEIRWYGFHYDKNDTLTPQLDVTDGAWAVNLRGIDVAYEQLAKACASGSFVTDAGKPYNRNGQFFSGLTKGKNYEIEYYRPGTSPLVSIKAPFLCPSVNTDKVIYEKPTGTGESVSTAFVEPVLLDEEHKATARSVATGPVKLRVLKVGGGYDTGFQVATMPAGKDYYEYANNTILADGIYTVTSQLISDPSKEISANFEVKTQVKRLTIYPTNVTGGVMYGIGIAARTSPKNLTIQINRPVTTTPGYPEVVTMGNTPANYTGTDDTHRYNYGSNPPNNTYDFENPHEYQFRIGTSGDFVSVNAYARNGDGVGVRRDVYPKTVGGSIGEETLETAGKTWINENTFVDASVRKVKRTELNFPALTASGTVVHLKESVPGSGVFDLATTAGVTVSRFGQRPRRLYSFPTENAKIAPEQIINGGYWSPRYFWGLSHTMLFPVAKMKQLGWSLWASQTLDGTEFAEATPARCMRDIAEQNIMTGARGNAFWEKSLQQVFAIIYPQCTGDSRYNIIVPNIESTLQWGAPMSAHPTYTYEQWEAGAKNISIVCEVDGVTRTLDQLWNAQPNGNLWYAEEGLRFVNRIRLIQAIYREKVGPNMKWAKGTSYIFGEPQLNWTSTTNLSLPNNTVNVRALTGGSDTITLNESGGTPHTYTLTGKTTYAGEDFHLEYDYAQHFRISSQDYQEIWVQKK